MVHRCRVFVAEDDDELRAVLAAAFRRDGHEVFEAVDGPGLVHCLIGARADGHPLGRWDVVVSDIRMPGFTGLQLLASFHNLRWDTPFILISGFADRVTEEHARRLGAAAVFSKPFDVDDLRAAVLGLAAGAEGHLSVRG
jgi:two-component system response regulator (stage 0 sporulation protein F)